MVNRRFISFFVIKFTVFVILYHQTCFAGSEGGKFSFEIISGFFVPDNPGIRGEKIGYYSNTGELSSIDIWGFGYGVEVLAAVNYHLSSWTFQIRLGKKWLNNGPTEKEKEAAIRYNENKLGVHPFVLNVLKEIDFEDSRITPFAGAGLGIYYLKWTEKYTDFYPDYMEGYLTDNSKIAVGFNFIVGAKYRILKNFLLKYEYSYSYVRSEMEIFRYSHNAAVNNVQTNVGGNSFRLGMIYGL